LGIFFLFFVWRVEKKKPKIENKRDQIASDPKMETPPPTIHLLSKKGRHSKGFDSRATHITRDLYSTQLGGELVTKELIRTSKIRNVAWIESADGTPVAAAMLIQMRSVYFRVGGLAVDNAHKHKGYGTALMARLHELMPSGSRLILGVDKDREATEWLVEWYKRLGFIQIDETHDEIVMGKSVF
jgi:N-acetylglutamate synthase-like GNAT family acetyltransferase